MTKKGAPCWQAAAVLFGGLSLLLAWDSLQAQTPEPTPPQFAGTGIATGYQAISRAEIMISAAGRILN
jgi:hypothetical protein